jgi:DNA (cytosine-5)-methyltransferase 1
MSNIRDIKDFLTKPSINGNFTVGCFSLFSGPGGLDLGFENAGAKILFAGDIDKACVETYNANRKDPIAVIRDLSKISVDEILNESDLSSSYDILGVIGGPPCQSFSYANVYATESDPRHKLPEHYARILKGLKESIGIDFFLFENVPGLISPQHLEKFERFKNMFEDAGFNIFQGALNAVDFGVAQVRPRVFVVGINKKKYPNLKYHFEANPFQPQRTVRDVIGGLPEPVYYKKGLNPLDFPLHPNHWCLVPRSSKFTKGFNKKMGGKSFKVLDWDRPSYTVAYGHREVHVHPNEHRRLSIFEAMLLQGFDQRYVLKGTLSDQIRQVSEAVCPVVAYQLASSIIKLLSEAKGGEKIDTQPTKVLAKAIS